MDKFEIIILIISFVGVFISMLSKKKAKRETSQMPPFSGEEAQTRTFEYEIEEDDDWLPRGDYQPMEEPTVVVQETTTQFIQKMALASASKRITQIEAETEQDSENGRNEKVAFDLSDTTSVKNAILWSEILKPKF